MPKCLSLLIPLLLMLVGCSQDVHFQIRFNRAEGLTVGAPLVVGDQKVGEVTEIHATPANDVLVSVTVQREHMGAATEDSRFYLVADPKAPGKKRVEIIQYRPGGKPIAEGAVVQGSSDGLLGLFPFDKIIQEFTGLLRQLRAQVETLGKELQSLPDSADSQNLQKEWRKLLEEIGKAQGGAEDAIKQEVLPKLQEEMEALRKRLEQMRRPPASGGKPLET